MINMYFRQEQKKVPYENTILSHYVFKVESVEWDGVETVELKLNRCSTLWSSGLKMYKQFTYNKIVAQMGAVKILDDFHLKFVLK